MPSKRLKTQVRELLVSGELEAVAELAPERKRVLATLVALTFDVELVVVWRAIEAMGMAAEHLAGAHKGFVREHMRHLYWLITEESGSIFWRAPECMAECCVRLPVLFKSHIPIAFHLLETLEKEDLEHFRPGALWAIGRLFPVAREALPGILPLVLEALDRPDPQSRGMAVWCLGQVGEGEAVAARGDLLEDGGSVHLYQNRAVEETTVGRLAREVLDRAAQQV